jgi:hypothetical protein
MAFSFELAAWMRLNHLDGGGLSGADHLGKFGGVVTGEVSGHDGFPS